MEIIGALLALIGGITNGSYPTPKNKIKSWNDSQIWSVFSLVTFLFIPLTIILSHSNQIALLSMRGIEVLVISGVLFSIGMICFTLSLRKIGLGPSFSLNIILNTSLGTLIPLFLFHFDKVASLSSLFIYIGIALFIISILLLNSSLKSGSEFIKHRDRALGIFLGILSGILTSIQSSAYNYAIKDLAAGELQLVLNKLTIWSVFFIASFFIFFLFHFIGSTKNIRSFKQNKRKNILMIGIMAVSYYLSIMLFSWSTNYISVPIAWPIFMTAIVLTTNFWSNKNQELKGIRKKHYRMYLIITLVAFIFFALSMRLGN